MTASQWKATKIWWCTLLNEQRLSIALVQLVWKSTINWCCKDWEYFSCKNNKGMICKQLWMKLCSHKELTSVIFSWFTSCLRVSQPFCILINAWHAERLQWRHIRFCPYCRQCKKQCLILFSLSAHFPVQDLSGDAQTNFGTAHYRLCLLLCTFRTKSIMGSPEMCLGIIHLFWE